MQLTLRTNVGMLIGLAAATGALGVAAMMSTATAHADDFTDVVNAVEGDYSIGQADFTAAATDFAGGHVNDGLAALLGGFDEDFIGAPDSLDIGTLDLLANDPVLPGFLTVVPPVTDFSDAVTLAQEYYNDGLGDFTAAAASFSAGMYDTAAYLADSGVLNAFITPAEFFLEGAVASF